MVARTRSPNYPVIDLQGAVDLVTKLERMAKRHPVPAEAAIANAWEFKPGSYGFQCIAALKQFGLIQEEEGANRPIRLTDEAQKVVHQHPDRAAILRAAAIKPKVHAAIWAKFGGDMPPAETIKNFLVFDNKPPFNPASVPDFIAQFKATISFAGLDLPGSKVENDPVNYEKPKKHSKIKVGELVQWESGGVLQLPEPRKVTRISDDGAFVFVDGSATGLPIEEVSVVTAPAGIGSGTRHAGRQDMTQKGFKQDVYHFVDGGQVILQWPEGMSKENFEEFEDWIKLELRKIARAVKPAAE